jgi:hypothetical protein
MVMVVAVSREVGNKVDSEEVEAEVPVVVALASVEDAEVVTAWEMVDAFSELV